MGDRTWLNVEIHKKDIPAAIKILEEPPLEVQTNRNSAQLYYTEVNYGGFDLLEEMVERKINFQAEHGRGDNYNQTSFICFDGKMQDITSNDSGYLVNVSFDENGAFVSQSDLEEAQDYFNLKQQFTDYLEST